jgi:hypothetical protein
MPGETEPACGEHTLTKPEEKTAPLVMGYTEAAEFLGVRPLFTSMKSVPGRTCAT